jgi:hypothetical protein
MQCLDASAEDLRRTGKLGNLDRGNSFGLQGTGGASRRENFDAVAVQFAGKINNAGLVRD